MKKDGENGPLRKVFGNPGAAGITLAAVAAALLSSAVTFGLLTRGTGYRDAAFSQAVPMWFLLALILFAAYLALANAFNRFRNRGESTTGHGRISAITRIAPRYDTRSIALHALVMVALWLPIVIAMYPGSMNWDTYYQIRQCYGGTTVWVIPWAETGSVADAHFSDHHPIFDTLVFGLFARASDALFGSWNQGVFLYVCLQAASTALALTWATASLEKAGVGPIPRTVSYACFCLLPFFPLFGAAMLKDSLHAPIFVVYLVMVVECVRTRGASLVGSKRATAAFVIIGIALALTRKPGLYVVLISALVLMFVFRAAWKAYVAQVVAVAITLFVILPLIVFPALDVIPGGRQEALGTLFQQTARYVSMYPDEVSSDERDAIDTVIDYGRIPELYDPLKVDPVKFTYRYDSATGEDIVRYLGVWARQGLLRPEVYLDSVLAVSEPFIDVSGTIDAPLNTSDAHHAGTDKLHRPQALKPLWSAVAYGYRAVSQIPVVGVLFSCGLYSFIIPSIALVTLASRRSRYAWAFVPIALCFAVSLVAPVFEARYVLPLIYSAPLIMSLVFEAPSRWPYGDSDYDGLVAAKYANGTAIGRGE